MTRVTTGAAAGLGATFLIHFVSFARATFTSEGHFELDFAYGTTIFMESTFFFPGAIARLPGVFLAASIFLFFEASVTASVTGPDRAPYDTSTN
jgi:hypothetical protein